MHHIPPLRNLTTRRRWWWKTFREHTLSLLTACVAVSFSGSYAVDLFFDATAMQPLAWIDWATSARPLKVLGLLPVTLLTALPALAGRLVRYPTIEELEFDRALRRSGGLPDDVDPDSSLHA
jgi:hypothetical protein